LVGLFFGVCRRGAQGNAAQRTLEVADGSHRDRIDHLLVELRIALGRRQAVLSEKIWIVEIDRRIGHVACGIDIDHLDVLAHRPQRQPPTVRPSLPRHTDHDFLNS
jgi:hypothetical protein